MKRVTDPQLLAQLDGAPAGFNAEGADYDMASATAAGLKPDATGHWPSRVPETGLLLKGRGHETWSKTEEGEKAAGMEIAKGQDGRYYSKPIRKPVSDPALLAELEKPAAEPGVVDQALNVAGRTARAAVKGATALPGMVANLPAGLYNKVADFYDSVRSPDMGELVTGKKPGFRFPDQTRFGEVVADKVGLPAPQSAEARIGEDVAGSLVGAGGIIKAGSDMAAKGGTAITRAIGDALQAYRGRQLAASVTGTGAGSGVREAGGGEGAQLAATVAGTLAPSAPSLIASAVKAAVRGGEAGRQRVASTIQDFEDAGAGTPTVGQATQGRAARATESGLSKAPGGAGRMVAKAEGEAAGIGEKVDEIASSLSARSGAAPAGREIRAGLGRFADNFKKQSGKLYDELDNHITQDARIDVTNAQKALAELNAAIPGAPNLSKFFQNAKIRGVENAMAADVAEANTTAKLLETAKGELVKLEKSRADAMQEWGKFKTAEQASVNRGDNFVPVQGLPRVTGRYSAHPERAAENAKAAEDALSIGRQRVAELEAKAQQIASLERSVGIEDGKLPYEAIKKLRTLVGNEISNSNLVSDVPRSKWKALYGALSQDLEAAAASAGPEAQKAFARANKYYSAGMGRIDDVLDPILKKTDPEDVFKAAVSGTSEGSTTIRGVMKSLPEESRKIVGATTLRRLGRAVNSKQDDLGEVFSTETFLTNWNKITPESKTALFSGLPDDMRKDLDKIARVASNIRDGSKVFANPSGTAQAASNQLTAGAAVISLLTGQWPVAGAIAGGVASANASARLMTNPDFVRWLAKSTRAPVEQLPAQLNSLSQSIFRMDEDERAEAQQFVKTAREALRTEEARPSR